jgi:DNA-binding Xre family transcriptional regulator
MNNQNITDQELSDKSGVHFNTIRLIKSGVFKQPRITTLRKLAKALGCTPKEIGG